MFRSIVLRKGPVFTQDAASSKIVAQACRQHACPSEVHRVVEVLKGLEDRGDNVWKRTYTIAMVHCLRHKKPMKALDLMNDLRDKGCQLTPNLYAILVNIYAEQRLPDKIRQTIREMRSYNMPVTVQTYNGLFKAMIRAKDPQINEIRKAFLYKRIDCKPNLHTRYYTVLSCDNLADADFTIREMRKEHVILPQRHLLVALLHVCRYDKKWGRVRANDEMKAAGEKDARHYLLWMQLGPYHGSVQYVVDTWDFISRDETARRFVTQEILKCYFAALTVQAAGAETADDKTSVLNRVIPAMLQYKDTCRDYLHTIPPAAFEVFRVSKDEGRIHDFKDFICSQNLDSDTFMKRYHRYTTAQRGTKGDTAAHPLFNLPEGF